MPDHSWLMLDHESPRHRLPDDLRARDPLDARDCGWVEQMTPFIRRFSQPGDTVFDPFAGFGTTLLAARLEGRRAAGCEVDADRLGLIRERLARHGIGADDDGVALLHGSCDALDGAAPQPFELCLTNVPYFGCRWPGAPAAGQLYGSRSYAQHLEGLRDVFHAVRTHLSEDGHCIAMVQNLRIGERMLPLAFDLARILGSLFTMEEERVLIYPHGEETGAAGDVDAARTDRRHEYALVFRKQRARIDLQATAELLEALRAQGHAFTLVGSFARWLQAPEQSTQPADADIRVAADPQRLDALLRDLRDRGFALASWDEPVALPLHFESYRGRYYFRAERVDSSGAMVRLDICYEQ
ncbi:UNVERIFIED_ORG: hypothetical protein ABIC43_006847 [Variovorax guangxiensis]